MIEVEKEKKYLLVTNNKMLVNVNVYNEMSEREIKVFIARTLNIPVNKILKYTRTIHFENTSEDSMYYILEVEILKSDVFHLLEAEDNFIFIVAGANNEFDLNHYIRNSVRFEFSDILVLKKLFKRICPNSTIMTYSVSDKKITHINDVVTDRIILNSDSLGCSYLKSYQNYDLVKDEEMSLIVNEKFKGHVFSESLAYEILKWCEANYDYELAQDIKDVESLGGGFKGKLFVAVDNPDSRFKNMKITILRKRKLGE